MSDSAYERAILRLTALKKEMSEIEEFIRLYKKFSGEARDSSHESHQNVSGTKITERGHIDAPKPKNPPRDQVRKIAREILLERGRPLTRGELLGEFSARGVPIRGADPTKNIGTLMWRMADDFVNIEGHGYWLRDVACERAGYKPSATTKRHTDQRSILE